MSQLLQHQLRVYLDEAQAAQARLDPRSPRLAPLPDILDRHNATLVCQLAAFEAYVEETEAKGAFEDPLYKWTKAILRDPASRAKHAEAFAIRVGGNEVYPKSSADALEGDLKPLVGGAVVKRMSRHDTSPATNIPIPAEYR